MFQSSHRGTHTKLAWVLLPTNSSSITLSSSARASLKTVTKAPCSSPPPLRLNVPSVHHLLYLNPQPSILHFHTLNPQPSTKTPRVY